MKKQLITLATATAMTAPAAVLADAHSDGPEVYGRAHLSVDVENYDDAAGDSGDIAIASRASRLGFRGSEEIGGLEAFYQAEAQVDWGTPGNFETQARDTFVGLGGNFGELRAGRLPALNHIVYGPGNFFPTQTGDPGNVIFAATGGNLGGRTPSAAIEYVPPLAGPVDIAVALTPSAAGDADEGYDHDISLVVDFNEGPISARATVYHYNYDETEETVIAGLDPDANPVPVGEQLSLEDVNTDTLFALSGEYDMDIMRFGGGFAAVSSDRDDADNQAVWGGGAFDVTSTGTFNAQASLHLGDADDSDVTILALGYTETLSDRTSVYGNIAFLDNDDAVGVAPHGYAAIAPQDDPGTGEDGQVLSAGVIHDF